jgi:hypothetical protein
MKTLSDYITESEQWMHTPAEGDVFAIELDDGVLIETWIMEVVDDSILLDSTEHINQVLAEWAALEDTDEGDSGVIMETMGYGVQVGEGAMKHEMMKNAERMSLEQFKDRYGDEDWIEEFWRVATGETEQSNTDEAKYQGREVQLNKKLPGDTKKFKVYVKDPSTGNVKKVNFGHGGKTARKLGQKTMRIRKSNPAARKSFRARHNCDNPGPKTKARYWSCRNW